MPIVKRLVSPVLTNTELIKLKRQARVYKVLFGRIINIIVTLSIMLAFYYYRNLVSDILDETKASYSVLYQQINTLSESFGRWCNKGIDSVEISGLKNLDKQEIISTMYKLDGNDNVQMLGSVKDMHDNILSIPLIKSVLIRRVIWNNKIFINIKERNVIATVKDKLTSQAFLLDDEGVKINYNAGIKFDNLPIIEDSEHPEKLIAIYEYLKEKNVYDKIYGFSMVSQRRWNIRFKNNLIVKLPAKEWQDSIDILLHIDERVNLFAKDNTMTYIDLRIPGKIFLK